MIKKLLILLVVGFPLVGGATCSEKPVKIAVIDTGFGYLERGLSESKLCRGGHKDFTEEKEYTKTPNGVSVPLDRINHGTNITGIIEGYAKSGKTNYCIVILKFYSYGTNTLENTVNAIKHATKIDADIINYSAGGYIPSQLEKEAITAFLDRGGIFVTAAGNEGKNLNFPSNAYYPALYDPRIVVVGSANKFGGPLLSSNYGKAVDRWEPGSMIKAYGIVESGTSQAAAAATGKIVSENPNKCDMGDK